MVQSGRSQTYSTQEVQQVYKVKFGLFSEQDILNYSVCEVNSTQIYDNQTMTPFQGGINDLRMGTCDDLRKCLTCDGGIKDCPGHFGDIKLARPVYHYGYLDITRKILSCVCFKCSRLLIAHDDPKLNEIREIKDPRKRLNELYKTIGTKKKKVCSDQNQQQQNIDQIQIENVQDNKINDFNRSKGCGYIQPTFTCDKLNIKFKQEYANDDEPNKDRDFQAQDAFLILKQITDEDSNLLGLNPKYNRPENLVLKALLVAPPPVRPSISLDANARSEDDLTHQYKSIIQTNNLIKKQIEDNMAETQIEKTVSYLQTLVATLMNNEINGVPQSKHKSGKQIKSIRERLKGKQGRLRMNLMGKRVDFSARTVVSPDPNLSVDELGVPMSIALNLTFPEVVTPLNIDRLKKLVINGPTEWPGAKNVIRNDGQVIDLRYAKNKSDDWLQPGFIVERHIVDGDYVVFNRQPSLHRMSMMGHRIRILPYSTFRLNLSVTTPYNADFDGDEMNMHVPQSYETRSEIKNIMLVPNQIISPQANKPVMGIVQDTLVGVRLFTRRSTFLNEAQMMNLLMWIEDWDGQIPPPAILKPEKLWTGKQMMSLILPQVNLEKKTQINDGDNDQHTLFLKDGQIIIEKGQLLTGILDKGTVGSTNGGILHCIWLDYGPQAAAKFLSQTQKLVNNWLVTHSMSVGCIDIFPNEACKLAVEQDLQRTETVVSGLYQKAILGQMDHQPGKSLLESFEANINIDLNNIFKDAQTKAQAMMTDRNRIFCMVAAGSKGSQLNIAQIMVCVGQQNVEGKRIPYGFSRRTLPHFTKDDYGSESRGFVKNSYLTGLTPDEFFFHAMGGREGLIDTAVKTSETGYIQRRLIKALEDIMVKYDSTVRDSSGNIVQFLYGEDGMDGQMIETYVSNFIEYKDADLERELRFLDEDAAVNENNIEQQLEQYQDKLHRDVIDNLLNNQESLQELYQEFRDIKRCRDQLRQIFPNFDKKYHQPVNIPRLISQIKINFKDEDEEETGSRLNPVYVVQQVNKTIQNLILTVGSDEISQIVQKNGTLLMCIMMKFYLNSKKVCIKESLQPKIFDIILKEIEKKFNHARAQPGEMIGILCAQSIGEPTTQMTLNTFHSAGVSAKNVTLGVPRLKEILNVGENIKTPSNTIFIKPQFYQNLEENKNQAIRLQQQLEFLTLGQLTKYSEIYYDPDVLSTIIEDDREFIQTYMEMPDESEEQLQNVSCWLLRIFCDKNSLIDKDIELVRLKEIIQKQFPDRLQVIINEEFQSDNPVIRIRLKSHISDQIENEDFSGEQINQLRGIEQSLLYKIRIKGILNIKRVYMKKFKSKYVDQDGSLQNKEEWILETDGSNLKAILSHELVDHRRTITNSNKEILNVLGIEAARQGLIKEIRVIFDSYGIYVNYRHLSTLCDIMTQRGVLTSISRHGINRVVEGPLRKASFEQTVEILFSAGAFGEVQRFKGITENIMFGQRAPVGSGAFQLVLDVDKIKDPRYVPEDDNFDYALESQEESFAMRDMNEGGGTTPQYPKTPLLNDNINTPQNNLTPYYTQFTPQTEHGFISPNYPTTSPQIQTYTSPAYVNNLYSPGYKTNITYNPTAIAQSPSSSVDGSPKYLSPHQTSLGQSYSPQSPSYIGGSPLTSKNQSPNSPGYANSMSSPNYGQNYSPSTPNYSQSPQSSNTPLTLNLGSNQLGSSNLYSPNSPIGSSSINQSSGQYNPKSPAYNPSFSANIIKQEADLSSEEEDEES